MNNTPQTALELAQDLQAAGHVATIPIVAGTKRPAIRWTQFQEYGPCAKELPALFHGSGLTVGVLTGAPSDRLAVIDCDSHKTFDQMIYDLGNPATWVIQTARGGHVYMRTPETVKTTRGNGFDVKAAGGYVLAPGAIHPSGARYAWLQHARQILEWGTLAIPGLQLTPAPLRPENMPRPTWAMLQGAYVNKYDSKSEHEAAIVTGMINAGFDFRRVLDAFTRHAYRSSHFQTALQSSQAQAESWLRRTYEAQARWATANESEAHRTAHAVLMWAASATWGGRSGSYTRAVAIAHAEIAERAGALEYQASVRELAERAGASIRAVSNANKRLLAANVIELETPHTATLARLWVLRTVTSEYTLSVPQCGGVCSYVTAAHDAFRARGLGKPGAQVWTVLQAGKGLRVSEIAKQSGRARMTVWRVLKTMCALGMARAEIGTRGAVWFANDTDLDQIAQELGVSGSGKRQRARHAEERRGHRAEIERRRFA
jgi:predicted transcriptional regulator